MDHPIIVSIGMPVFNAEKHLKIAIESVLNQEFKDFELIISDDGSTDDSLSIIQSYTDKRIKLLSDSSNKGIGYRLNEQIAISKGIYFARMDSDDIMFPDRILEQVKFLQEHPNVDVVGGSAVVINEYDQITGLRKTKPINKFLNVLEDGIFIHPTVMGKSNWFKQHYYDGGFSGTEDRELFMRTYQESNFSNLDYPVLFYRDSHHFKLNTYLERQQELIKGLDKNAPLFNAPIKIQIVKLKIYLKSILFQLMHLVNLHSVVIKNRNEVINTNQLAKYHEILLKELQK
ncbi:MAG: glycosyltransferase [Bacteroidetes bacterium]|nr:glycosyltransferase [Bacteroidota bacterium]